MVLNCVTANIEDSDALVKRVKYLYGRRSEKGRDEFALKNGTIFDRYTAPLVDSKDQYRGRIWYFRDITDRKVAEQQVQYLAYYDDLTGLANRTLLQDRLSRAMPTLVGKGIRSRFYSSTSTGFNVVGNGTDSPLQFIRCSNNIGLNLKPTTS